MILLVGLGLSALIVSLSMARRMRGSRRESEEHGNQELEMYFVLKNEGVSGAVLAKQLVKAATCFRERIAELERDLDILGVLYEDRMIGEEHWERMNEDSRCCEVEKMCIESEANMVRPGFGDEVFREAGRAAAPSKKKSVGDNSFYLKKKEVLEAELMRRLSKTQ